jgi:hypothetical protein
LLVVSVLRTGSQAFLDRLLEELGDEHLNGYECRSDYYGDDDDVGKNEPAAQ